jgi:hypothetical protein
MTLDMITLDIELDAVALKEMFSQGGQQEQMGGTGNC